MFRIRRIYDTKLPINRHVIGQVQGIIRTQFKDMLDSKILQIPEKLSNPLKFDFLSGLLVSDDRNGKVKGFALFSLDPSLGFGFLDLIALTDQSKGGGLGAALYQRVQQECASNELKWLLFECMSDDAKEISDTETLKENIKRMRFYERLGARPVIGTLYQEPRKANFNNPYYLMVDDLVDEQPIYNETGKTLVRAILKRKYRRLMSTAAIDRIVDSITDETLQLRPNRYKKHQETKRIFKIPKDRKIKLCVSDAHVIHHIKDHTYAEQPVRVSSILNEINKTELFERIPRRHFSDRHLLAVHDRKFVNFFREVSTQIEADKPLFPDVFPIRKNVNNPRNIPSHAGYYCIDIYSPIFRDAYIAAREAVNAALSAASAIECGDQFAYALVRPPGHHASNDSFGGYCYFNSTAIAANYLSRNNRVAILDLDYHHGNGQQDIFYRRSDVLTISIHGDPTFEYPYFSGYSEETGEGEGIGFNLNLPLKRNIDGAVHLQAIRKAIKRIQEFKPEILIIALGLDTARNDPSGTWNLDEADFFANGQILGKLRYPTLAVQEGGYDCTVLGRNAVAFLSGLWSGFY